MYNKVFLAFRRNCFYFFCSILLGQIISYEERLMGFSYEIGYEVGSFPTSFTLESEIASNPI